MWSRSLLATALTLVPLVVSAQDATQRAQVEARQYLGPCVEVEPAKDAGSGCEFNRGEFLRNYQQAKAGNYQGQRNAAYYLSRGEGPVRQNRIQGCAWRIVIISQGHAQVGDGDTSNFQRECGVLNAAERQAAVARGEQLLREIRTSPARMPTEPVRPNWPRVDARGNIIPDPRPECRLLDDVQELPGDPSGPTTADVPPPRPEYCNRPPPTPRRR